MSGINNGEPILCLSVSTDDGKEERAYYKFSILSFIQPERIFLCSSYSDKYSLVQGLYRLGDRVSLIGKAFGTYRLEWKKSDGTSWSTDYFDYNVREGYLAIWDTSSITGGGVYQVRLVVLVGSESYTEIKLDADLKRGWPLALSPLDATGELANSSIA